MPPHTISPTPDSQGLGISFSTLSPGPVQNGHSHHQPISFTGIGALPRPATTAPIPAQQPIAGPSQQSRDLARPLPPTSTSGAPLYQPGFSLRPTHTRGGSKGFSSFSAVPPSSDTHVPAPRQTGQQQQHHQQQQQPDKHVSQIQQQPVRGFLPREDESVESETQYSHHDEEEQPLRRPSVTSNGTSGSRHSSRRNKSVDYLRSLSRGSDQTVGAGAYVPMPDKKEHEEGHQSGDVTRTRSSTLTSTIATGAITNNGTSIGGPTPSDTLHSFHPGSFPLPPSGDVQPHPAQNRRESPQTRQANLARGMSRSRSTPTDLQAVPESNEKRMSDPSTGMHSRNRVLLNAEAGGMMLAFSPGGQYRPGQQIVGPGSSLMQTPASASAARRSSIDERVEESLKSRPWSNSTMSQHGRPITLGHRGRSLSDGAAILARQGTLFHPGSSKQRSSAELNLMLGQPRSRRLSGNRILPPPDLEAWTMAGGATDDVRLEAAKRKKARVEVDVVLERECVVEGGEVRGRLEIRVNGGKRGEGLRVAGGKVRVVGFEDISASQRHIFYHQPHPLNVFDRQEDSTQPLPSLFASGPDEEGYRLAAEGVHCIPFRMRIPMNTGAKGSFSSPGNKGPCVRYVVVGSVKLYIPSTMKRSIAHFYRSIVILPYLNPSIVLAPSFDPIESVIEGGLGWSLGGEKGKVEVRVGLGRRTWVAGQRVWCEIGVRNNSSRKIKTVTMALLQTVTTFHPDAGLDTGDFAARLRRRSANLKLSKDGMATPEMDACHTSTVRRKITEESMEADSTGPGEGRVTGKSWWTGVEPGDRDHWDMSMLIPNGLLTIRRTRLIEVTYTLRVTVNGSIYVDLPVNLINFLSIDPPPMPGDGARSPASAGADSNVAMTHPMPPHAQPTRMASDMSLNSSGNPARASSTTLHIDALLQAGRARAEAEALAQTQGTEQAHSGHSRHQSLGSQYTLPHGRSFADLLALDPPPLPEMGAPQQQHQHRRPAPQTMMSFMSERSDHTHDASMSDEVMDDALDEMLRQARPRTGRQESLALAIGRAEQRALQAMEQTESESGSGSGHPVLSPGKESIQLGQFKPDGTPFEHEVYEMGHMPPVPDVENAPSEQPRLRVRNASPGQDEDDEDDTIEAGDQTILLELVRDQLPEIRSSSPMSLSIPSDNVSNGVYDYAPESTDFNPASPQPDQSQQNSLRARYAELDPYASLSQEEVASQTRSRFDSIAVSESDGEVGQVTGAVKRNLSVRLPATLVSSDRKNQPREPRQSLTPSLHPDIRRENAARHPSPLRNVQQLPEQQVSGLGSSPSRPLPTSPSKRYFDHTPLDDTLGPSPRSQPLPHMSRQHVPSVSSRGSAPSQLRRQVSLGSRYGSAEDESPGLAPSVASDSASSEGHLESPPHSALPIETDVLPDVIAKDGSRKGSSISSTWVPGDHMLNQQVYLQTQAVYSNRQLPETPKAASAALDALSSDSHSAPGSPQTVESMLPSVRTKIEQLNTREEALRKFSVTGALSPSTPRASIGSNPRGSISIDTRQSIVSNTDPIPLVTSPSSISGRYTPTQALSPTSPPSSVPAHLYDQSPSKRRSYTAALGPKAVRTMSKDSEPTEHSRSGSTHKIGNTTYLTKRSFAQARHISPTKTLVTSPSSYTPSMVTTPEYYSPFEVQRSPPVQRKERTLSVSSTSTSATTIEAALMRRPGGPRGPASPASRGPPRQEARYAHAGGGMMEEDDSDGLR